MKFNVFSYFIHLNSDTAKELKWFSCSNISINILVQDRVYKRVDINKRPDSLQIFITSIKQYFIDKENISWIYFNTSSQKLGDAIIKLGLFDKSKKLNGEKHFGYLIINSIEGALGYALTL